MESHTVFMLLVVLLLAHAPCEGTQEASSNDMVTLIKHIIDDIAKLSDRIQSQESRFTKRIQALQTETTVQLKALEEQMNENFQLHDIKQTEKIELLEMTLKKQIEQVNDNMTRQMQEEEEKMRTKMLILETKMSERVKQLSGDVHLQEIRLSEQAISLSKEIAHVNSSIEEELKKEEVKMTSKIKEQDSKMDGINKIVTGALVGERRENPAPSCVWIRDHYFNLRRNGWYWISSGKQVDYLYCDMDAINGIFSTCTGQSISARHSAITYPLVGNYHNNEDCELKINIPGTVTLAFAHFDIWEARTADYVSILNNGKELGRWGRYTGKPPLLTLSGSIKMRFHSDHSGVATGFTVYIV